MSNLPPISNYASYKAKYPKDFVQLYEEAGLHPSGTRERRAEILKKMFDKNKKGKLVVNFNKPFFTQALEQYKQVEGKETTTSLPYLVMCEQFKAGEEGLRKAIDAPLVKN